MHGAHRIAQVLAGSPFEDRRASLGAGDLEPEDARDGCLGNPAVHDRAQEAQAVMFVVAGHTSEPKRRPGSGKYGNRTAILAGMNSYGQFCAIARALEVLGERWTLLIVRELLLGEQHFNDISRGIPRISKTMLSARLKDLQDTAIVTRGSSATSSPRPGSPSRRYCGSSAAGQ